MTDKHMARFFDFLLTTHRDISPILKWIVIIISGLTGIAAALLFSGNIVADLTLDDGEALNPYLALSVLSVFIVLLIYLLVFLVRLIVKLLLR